MSMETLRFDIVARRRAAEVAEERIRLGFGKITIMRVLFHTVSKVSAPKLMMVPSIYIIIS